MTAKAFVFIATSLDGFIARENGDLDWLPQGGSDSKEDFGYDDFYASIDTLVLGRKSFEKVITFGDWPYPDKRIVVLSSKGVDVPKELVDTIEVLAIPPKELINYLSDTGAKRLYVDGGNTIQRFLRTGLVEEMTITIVPVLLGAGVSLFGDLQSDLDFDLIESKSFNDGIVQSKYRLKSAVE